MTPWILLFQVLDIQCPGCPILVDIGRRLQDFQDDYRTSPQFHNLFLGKVFFLLENCGEYVQYFRTDINGQFLKG